ncbi:Sorting nexin-27-like [Oopsacas minuta]|uniref:Sorting nexin-27-like n=1 Tax=Oopsacas minuta TaxID=111878 RepID=A0AAV7JT06_9METZ|nr:Sorting nexin-27-like [Oopsacas minuta]
MADKDNTPGGNLENSLAREGDVESPEPNKNGNSETLQSIRNVTITKTSRGFGFNLRGQVAEGGQLRSIGGELYGPMQHISYVLQGGPADLAGVKEGDRILEVNGQSAQAVTHVKVVQMIQKNPEQVSLVLISVSKEEANKLDADFIHPPTSIEISERKHINVSIPEWRKIFSNGESYIAYNIYISGMFIISRRFSEFYTLNASLKAFFNNYKFPKLPKKWPIHLTDSQIEDRRFGLEHYLSNICSSNSVFSSDLVQSFLGIEGASEKDILSKSLPAKSDVILKILLPEKQYINITIQRAWTATKVLSAVMSKLNLSSLAERYFAIFEIMEHDFMRKLHETEFPHQIYIQNYDSLGETSIAFRKWMFSVSREILYDNDEKIFNIIYSQAKEDVNKGRIRPDADIKMLQVLQQGGKKAEYLSIVRAAKDYAYISFPPAITEARKDGQMIINVGFTGVELIACDANGVKEKGMDLITLEWDKIGEYYTDPEDCSFRFQILREDKSPKWVQINSKYYIYIEECLARAKEEFENSKLVDHNVNSQELIQEKKITTEASLKSIKTVSKRIPSPTEVKEEIQDDKPTADDEGL